jgi:hypothetical protein
MDGNGVAIGDSEAEILAKYREGGELIKRADGSYSKRGLYDNIRDNIGSGRKPTKQMLEQEAKYWASQFDENEYNSDDEQLTDEEMSMIFRDMEQAERELAKGTEHEMEHLDTLKKVSEGKITPEEAVVETAKTHIAENKNYYEDLAKMENENEESIPDLIEGLKVLLEYTEGAEKTELENTIEGLKLLLDDEKFEKGGELNNNSMFFEPSKAEEEEEKRIMESQFGKNI